MSTEHRRAHDADATFDRLRPRAAAGAGTQSPVGEATQPSDREGKRALFSDVSAPPTMGSVSVQCHRCQARSVVSWAKAVKLAFPTVPAIVPGSGVRVWMRCPSCEKRSWVSLSTRQ